MNLTGFYQLLIGFVYVFSKGRFRTLPLNPPSPVPVCPSHPVPSCLVRLWRSLLQPRPPTPAKFNKINKSMSRNSPGVAERAQWHARSCVWLFGPGIESSLNPPSGHQDPETMTQPSQGLEAFLGSLGVLLGRSWDPLGPSGVLLGRSWPLLGCS